MTAFTTLAGNEIAIANAARERMSFVSDGKTHFNCPAEIDEGFKHLYSNTQNSVAASMITLIASKTPNTGDRFNYAHAIAGAAMIDCFAMSCWEASDFGSNAQNAANMFIANMTLAQLYLDATYVAAAGHYMTAAIACSGWGGDGDHACDSASEFAARHLVMQTWDDEFSYTSSPECNAHVAATLALIAPQVSPEVMSEIASMMTVWDDEADDEYVLAAAGLYLIATEEAA